MFSLLIPHIAYAATSGKAVALALVKKIDLIIINPLIALMFAGALFMFIWGLVEYIQESDKADAHKKAGQKILWGVLGFAIMVSVYGIMQIIMNSLGVTGIDPATGDVNVTW